MYHEASTSGGLHQAFLDCVHMCIVKPACYEASNGFTTTPKCSWTTMSQRAQGKNELLQSQPEDRLFSVSSLTSQAAEELTLNREDGRLESGPGRYKSGGVPGSGLGKPKKGRAGSREGKRMRQADQDLDYEDDQ